MQTKNENSKIKGTLSDYCFIGHEDIRQERFIVNFEPEEKVLEARVIFPLYKLLIVGPEAKVYDLFFRKFEQPINLRISTKQFNLEKSFVLTDFVFEPPHSEKFTLDKKEAERGYNILYKMRKNKT